MGEEKLKKQGYWERMKEVVAPEFKKEMEEEEEEEERYLEIKEIEDQIYKIEHKAGIAQRELTEDEKDKILAFSKEIKEIEGR